MVFRASSVHTSALTVHCIGSFFSVSPVDQRRRQLVVRLYSRLYILRSGVPVLARKIRLAMMIMMMMNYFCGMIDRRKAFSLISSRDHCQRTSPSRIFGKPRAGYEPAQNLSLGFDGWSCVVVISTTPRHHGATWWRWWNHNFYCFD